MATSTIWRHVSRRFSTSNKVLLADEEKAAEKIYMKLKEQKKLEKLSGKEQWDAEECDEELKRLALKKVWHEEIELKRLALKTKFARQVQKIFIEIGFCLGGTVWLVMANRKKWPSEEEKSAGHSGINKS